MLDHISLGVSDLERSRQFYDGVLRPLGLVRTGIVSGGYCQTGGVFCARLRGRPRSTK
jgi:catechol 2,3-dioxygenase-like lactoylglutathione lyase family enzyme